MRKVFFAGDGSVGGRVFGAGVCGGDFGEVGPCRVVLERDGAVGIGGGESDPSGDLGVAPETVWSADVDAPRWVRVVTEQGGFVDVGTAVARCGDGAGEGCAGEGELLFAERVIQPVVAFG